MMIEKVMIQSGQKKYQKSSGASEDSNTGKLIPVDRKHDDSIRGKKSKK